MRRRASVRGPPRRTTRGRSARPPDLRAASSRRRARTCHSRRRGCGGGGRPTLRPEKSSAPRPRRPRGGCRPRGRRPGGRASSWRWRRGARGPSPLASGRTRRRSGRRRRARGAAPCRREVVGAGQVHERREHRPRGRLRRRDKLRDLEQLEVGRRPLAPLRVHVSHRAIGGAQVDADDITRAAPCRCSPRSGCRTPSHPSIINAGRAGQNGRSLRVRKSPIHRSGPASRAAFSANRVSGVRACHAARSSSVDRSI